MSLADRLRELFGHDDEPDEPEPADDEPSEEEDDENDPSVYPLW